MVAERSSGIGFGENESKHNKHEKKERKNSVESRVMFSDKDFKKKQIHI